MAIGSMQLSNLKLRLSQTLSDALNEALPEILASVEGLTATVEELNNLAGTGGTLDVTVDAGGTDATGADGTGATAASGTDATGAEGTGATGADGTAATGDTAGTNVAETRVGHVRYEAPIAAELISIVAAVDMANGVQILAAQPDFPRKLKITIVDANSSTSAGTVDVVGVGPSGEALSQLDLPLTGGSGNIVTDEAYATVTSITIKDLAGAAAGDTISVGVQDALGLPGCNSPASSAFAVYKAAVDNANEAVGTVDATAGTIIPTTACNAVRTYDFWYTYQVTPTQNVHSHTGPSHTHTGPSHTHTGPSHTHTGASHTHTGPSHTHTASLG
jgi:hypothetical protein